MTQAPLIVLDELELDALTELVNLGVSQAASSLGRMVKEEVMLSVPRVELVGIHQVFEGDITGRALLIFPEAKSLELVRAVVGGELSLEEITELEQEALAEIGNVILNGCLGTMANMLERSLNISLPEIVQGSAKDFFTMEPPPEGGAMVMFIYINFSVRQRDIDGYIALMMDMPSLVSLQVLLGEFIRRST